MKWFLDSSFRKSTICGASAFTATQPSSLQSRTRSGLRWRRFLQFSQICDVLEEGVRGEDQVGVDDRVAVAEDVEACLRELAVASGLRALMPEDLSPGVPLDGLGMVPHAVVDVGAGERGGQLRAERHRLPS